MGRRRDRPSSPLESREEPPAVEEKEEEEPRAFEEEDDDEPLQPACKATQYDEEDDQCIPSWNVVRAGALGAMLVLSFLLAIWHPAGTHKTGWPSKFYSKRKLKKPWPEPGEEVPGCNPVGNASKGRPSARLVRVFLLQRDERKNLADMINYHRQVLSPDQIVILDHRSDDGLTKRVLARFNGAGGHVWRCERDFAQHRADMLSGVMRLYAPYSTYLLPLDADEMLAVAVPAAPLAPPAVASSGGASSASGADAPSSGRTAGASLGAAGASLAWSAAELSGALAALPEQALYIHVCARRMRARVRASRPCDTRAHGGLV